MKQRVRKQSRDDFIRRIERLDPAFAAIPDKARDDRKPWEVDKSSRPKTDRPILMMLFGLTLASAAFFAIQNPAQIEQTLLTWGWPAEFLIYAMNGISVLILGMGVFLAANMVRIVKPRSTGRWSAAGLVLGAVAGTGLFNIPEHYVQAGYEYAGFDNATEIFDFAQEQSYQIANIDWASLVLVSSAAK